VFFEDFDKLDVGLTKRLDRRPLTNMEAKTVAGKATVQFKAMCLRAKKRKLS